MFSGVEGLAVATGASEDLPSDVMGADTSKGSSQSLSCDDMAGELTSCSLDIPTDAAGASELREGSAEGCSLGNNETGGLSM